MKNNNKVYYHSHRVKIEATTLMIAGIPKLEKVPFPSDYDFVEKIAIISINTSDDPNFKLGFRKNSEAIIEATHNSLFEMPKNVAPNDRFLKVLEVVKTDNKLDLLIEPNKDLAIGEIIEFDFIMVMTTEEKFSKRLLDYQ